MRTKLTLTVISLALLALCGCSALKGLVMSGETVLNNAMNTGHGTATNVADTATSVLK